MNIDELLSQPLPTVADNGFSRRVMKHIAAAERSRIVLVATGAAAAATLACLFVPMETVSDQLNAIVLQIGSSTTVGLAAAAMLLTYLWDRQYFRL